jgi:hypothetical protein
MGEVRIDLETFIIVKKDDLVGHDEPYLWVYGIVIDRNEMENRSPTSFIIKRNPLPGNLGGSLARNVTRAIPNDVGLIGRQVRPLRGQIAAGVVVIAWEHDNTPARTMQLAYNDGAMILHGFIQRRLEALDFQPATGEEIARILANMETALKQRMRETLGLSANNHDDLIDFTLDFALLDPGAPVSRPMDFVFKKTGIEYRAHGQFHFKP